MAFESGGGGPGVVIEGVACSVRVAAATSVATTAAAATRDGDANDDGELWECWE